VLRGAIDLDEDSDTWDRSFAQLLGTLEVMLATRP